MLDISWKIAIINIFLEEKKMLLIEKQACCSAKAGTQFMSQ